MLRFMLPALAGVSALVATTVCAADTTPGDEDPRALGVLDEPSGFSASEPRVAPPSPPVKGKTVYFAPLDNDKNCTVLFLYNTGNKDTVVNVSGYSTNGTLVFFLNIPLAAHSFRRCCSDSGVGRDPAWDDTVIVNFTTYTIYAALTLPKGCHATGYIAWDPTGAYDPHASDALLPLDFTSDHPRRPVP